MNKVEFIDLLQQERPYILGSGEAPPQRSHTGLIEFGVVSSDFEKISRKQGFSPNWMLTGSGGASTTGCFNKYYLESGRDEGRLKLSVVRKEQSPS